MILLLNILLIAGSIYWLLSDFFPAQSDDVRAVVALAEPYPIAKSALTASLKQTPNPNRRELRRIRSTVDEIIVTEMAKRLTGDNTLKTPSEVNVDREQRYAAHLSAIESKSWSEMNNQERTEFVVRKSWKFFTLLAFGIGTFLGLKILYRQVRHGYY